MAEKEIISVRIPHELGRYLYSKANQTGTNVTTIMLAMLDVAIRHAKETQPLLKKLKEQATLRAKLDDGGANIRLRLRSAYLLTNYAKLTRKLKDEGMISKREKKKVVDAMLERIKDIYGSRSEVYKKAKEAAKWSKSEKSNSTTKAEKEIISGLVAAGEQDIIKSEAVQIFAPNERR